MFSKEFLNGDVDVNELFQLQCEIWKEKNVKLFGISPNDPSNSFIVQGNLQFDQENYWNGEGTCALKEKFLTTGIIKDRNRMVNDTFSLSYNPVSKLISLEARFIYEAEKTASGETHNATTTDLDDLVNKLNELPREERDETVAKGEHDKYTFKAEVKRLAYLPLVIEYGYKLKNSEYALRVQATRNPYLLRKINGVVKQKGWVYKDGKFEDGVNHFKDVGEHNYPLLNALLGGEQVTEENFTEALDKMPEYDSHSALYFDFRWFEEVEDAVLRAPRRFINAEKGRVINYAQLINSHRRYANSELNELCRHLISCKSKIKALEVQRSVLFSPQDENSRAFSFTDTTAIFDAFKVTTNSLAGRIRVLLDNIYVEDGTLKVMWQGKEYNHYDLILGNVPEEIKRCTNLSVLSRSPYNYLNDAKRIMFCAKLRGQAVRVSGQLDDLTHEVPARVVFADLEGFSFGDSFVISESFAKKLHRNVSKTLKAERSFLKELSVGQELQISDLVEVDHKDRYSSWRDIYVEEVTPDSFTVSARAPFGVGDKITNLHGSKGIVSLILPDEEMPWLAHDLSENMPAGPVDVIVPGVSVYRRKSTGQIFEAISRALNLKEMPLGELEEKHRKEIDEYDTKSVFVYNGKEFKAPCGINHFIRLDHDATSKQSFSYIKSNTKFNLHIAEMELLNLAARGCYGILNELDIRSLNKHTNSLAKIKEMQMRGICPTEQANMPYLRDYFKYLGWDFHIDNNTTKDYVEDIWKDLQEVVTNRELSIFDSEEENLLI